MERRVQLITFFVSVLLVVYAQPGGVENKNWKTVEIGVSVAVSVAALLLLIFVIWWYCSGSSVPQDVPQDAEHTELDDFRVTRHDIETMTDFTDVLGSGGFGAVFSGQKNGVKVAVKILSQRSNQGEAEFLKEINILKNLRHENIVSLVGYCDEGVMRAIIYEFLHQDLTKFLAGNDCRLEDWMVRLRITLGIATGLCFMHEHRIAHGDLKPDNILLSESLESKLGDFGMCKQFPAEATYLYSPPCRGSIGFMDPGYHASCNYRLESDVYAFGIILLMLISGRPVISIGEDGYNINIIHELMGEDVEEVVDIKVAGRYSRVSAKSTLQLAQRCS